MSEGYKKILKIWLIVYVVFMAFRIINIFDDSIFKNVFSMGVYALNISSLILFVFVGNRGEDKIAKYGIIALIVYFVLTLGYKINIYDLGLSTYVDVGFKNKFFSILYYTNVDVITILEYMAILSLIKSNEKTEKFEALAIVVLVILAAIDLKNNIFGSTPGDFMRKIILCLEYISPLAKYAAIIFCLIDDNYYSNIFVTPNGYRSEVPVQQVQTEVTIKPVQPVVQPQPVQQPVQPQMQQPVQPQMQQPAVNNTNNYN